MAAEPTRRLLIAAAAAGSLGLAGCKGVAALGPVPRVSPDVVTLERAIAAEQVMVDRYRSAARQLATLGTPGKSRSGRADRVIAVILAEHEAHLRELRAHLVLPPRLTKTKFRPGSGRLPPLPALPQGGAAADLLAALAADEHAAATRLTSQLLAAPGTLAQLMAAISASEAAHVVFLRRAGTS